MQRSWKNLSRSFHKALFLIVLCSLSAPAQAEDRRYYSGFLGSVTENRWHEVFNPGNLRFASSALLGVGLGWERQIGASQFSYGVEFQAIKHFGRQDHFEFNVPVVLRYTPHDPSPVWLKSVAFGIGYSHATKIPQVEIDRKGASQRDFVYWMAEAEFANRQPGTTMFFRLHHRSDGYGMFDVSSGSTAMVLGWRRSF